MSPTEHRMSSSPLAANEPYRASHLQGIPPRMAKTQTLATTVIIESLSLWTPRKKSREYSSNTHENYTDLPFCKHIVQWTVTICCCLNCLSEILKCLQVIFVFSYLQYNICYPSMPFTGYHHCMKICIRPTLSESSLRVIWPNFKKRNSKYLPYFKSIRNCT